MKDRRGFLKIAVVAGAGTFAARPTHGFRPNVTSIEVFSNPAILADLIGSKFEGFALESGQKHSLELIEVTQAPKHWTKSTSLFFKSNRDLTQDIYRISHPRIIAFEALVVPVGTERGFGEVVFS